MSIKSILSLIDSEIALLKKARALLSSDGTKKTATPATRATPATLATPATPAAPKKHNISAAARKRIGDAQRRRWAKQKSVASK